MNIFRPLPEEMLKYARADTHYLLYIYDRVRNELIQRSAANENLLRVALQRSAGIASQKHEKEVYDLETGEGPNGWKGRLRKWQHPMTTQQMAVFKALHQWRDVTAREQDESVRYVLPNHMLFSLVERMPSDAPGVIGCCNRCPPMVRMNAQSIGILIQKTRMDAVLQPQQQQKLVSVATNEKSTSTPKKSTSIPRDNNKNNNRIKITKMELDPSVFDLEKVDRARREQAEKINKAVASLSGDRLDNMNDLDESASDLIKEIRSTLKLTLPFEGLKYKKLKDTATIESPLSSTDIKTEQEPQEHVYVPPSERETKKRKSPEAESSKVPVPQVQEEQDAIVLKDTMRKTKKKKGSKNKKKNKSSKE